MTQEKTIETHNPNLNPLASFAWFPPKVYFSMQEKEEKVILLLRRHWITNVGWVFLSALFSVIPFLFFIYKNQILGETLSGNINPRFSIPIVFIWYLLLFGFFFTKFLNWYFNVYLVTSKRVVDIDFKGLLYKHVSETELEKIQDVSHSGIGSFSILFNYGEVKIQTAAEYSDIEFERVPKPSEVHKIITELLDDLN